MNVKELIDALSKMDPKAEVHFSYDYGDHWHSQVAAPVEKVEAQAVGWSDYHSMGKLYDEESADMERAMAHPNAVANAVVLS